LGASLQCGILTVSFDELLLVGIIKLFHANERLLPGLFITAQLFPIWSVCPFICQVALTRKQRRNLCDFPVKLPPVTTCLTTQT